MGRKTDDILVIRLGAMGDIIHALPAATSLKASFPDRKLAWLVSPRWMPLLKGNPAIDELIPFERSGLTSLRATWRRLRDHRFDLAFDFQGLLQSALAGRVAHAKTLFGFSGSVARESHAAWFYHRRIDVKGPHRVERNLQLIAAAGASHLSFRAWIPEGREEGPLPSKPFILASPFAGWAGKEWPLQSFEQLAQILKRDGLELVLNVPDRGRASSESSKIFACDRSTIEGLIYATRRAAGIVGLDSGPLHLAAAFE